VTLFAVVGAIVLISRKQSWPALVLVAGTALGKAVTEIQKYEFNRLRPDENPHLVVVHDLSFPSGHSANAMMTYVALALFLAASEHRRFWLAWAVAIALLVGLSRVMLGVHWPSDVVGGWGYGLFWAFLIYGISRTGRRTGRVT
jgi:undecaprenyl-diphosphatase